MSKKFIVESQPPALTKGLFVLEVVLDTLLDLNFGYSFNDLDEKIRSVLGADVKFDQKKSAIVSNSKDFDLKTEIRLIRGFCLR